MQNTDPAEEWRRLMEIYAQMNEYGLQAVADEAYDLTDLARSALQAEIRTRGLNIKLRDSHAPPEGNLDPSELNLVVARRVWDRDEARRVKDLLEAASIPSYLGPDNLDRVDDFQASFEEGVDVKVRDVDQQRALWELNRSLPKDPGADAVLHYVCPKCKSPEIVFLGLEGEETEPAEDSVAASKFNWSCDACGHHWRDDGVEPEA